MNKLKLIITVFLVTQFVLPAHAKNNFSFQHRAVAVYQQAHRKCGQAIEKTAELAQESFEWVRGVNPGKTFAKAAVSTAAKMLVETLLSVS
ncbi:hypothetical protein HN446_04770 [bacterium]|jgi:hypothetical protein|nr:hypothetical protein [bacterium]